MRNLFFFSTACFLLFMACAENSPKAAEKMPPSVSNDTTDIAATIHGFFVWYDKFQNDTTRHIDFMDDSGKHLKINETALKTYLGEFQKSGFVSESFIVGEFDFYQKCAKLWQNEEKDGIPSGMDADKIFCAQDWDIDVWTKSPVRIVKTDDTHAKATLYGTWNTDKFERQYELVKENGKWLLTKIECDTGVK